MLRNLTYVRYVREGADCVQLARYLELEEGQDCCGHEYLIETPHHSIGFTPAELAELHAAIHEMLRMEEQHVDALTDGAEPKEDAEPGEAESEEPVSESDVSTLRIRLYGSETLMMGHPDLDCVRMRGWVDITPETESSPTSLREYGITDVGRRVLAERER